MLSWLLALPFRLSLFVFKLLLKLVLIPIKMVVAGLLIQLGMFLVVIADVAVLIFYIYNWIT